MLRILFVCSQNRLRSPTAEQVFSQYDGIECWSAGVHDSADVSLAPDMIQWADIIFVMEKTHQTKISKKFSKHLHGKRLVVLGIPDIYEYMDPTLIQILELKVPPLLRRRISS